MIDDLNLYGDLNSPETVIHCDPVSGLPLLSEKESIHKLILNYLPLPYSVAEFGCGQKAGIIIRMLCLVHGIPPHALQRLLIMERDMSPGTIEQTDYEKRPHALLSDNPLASRINSYDPAFRRFLENRNPEIEVRNNVLRTGQYHLRLQPLVQFKKARSHVAVLITFWDEDRSCTVERIADATLDRNGLFPVETLRTLLRAAEAWIFTAPLMGEYRLRAAYFTKSQREKISIVNGAGFSTGEISTSAHASLFRSLSGASEGTIGDPSTWTWVNNIFVGDDKKMHAKLQEQTGKGNPARSLVKSLVKARTAGELDRANEIRENLDDLARQLNLRKVLQKEALRCEKELTPLAEAANTVSHFSSLRHIADLYQKGSDLFSMETDWISRFHGTGVSLRRRIETAATCSRNSEGRIDARALNDHYFSAASETIRQMNHAGLDVFVDKVGNLHGLRLDREVSEDIATGALSISDVTRDSLCIASHIDTVFDAGKYDGRLGVFSGIEVVETLQNLERCFGVRVAPREALCPIMVSVYVGEEMTFSGENVSLPGSAAVAGLAEPEAIFRMTNAAGETWLDRLEAMWEFLREQIKEKRITLHQSQKLLLESDDRRFLPGPTQFRPRHYFERHVEQGTFLQRCKSPLVITERVAGVRHEDFIFEGSRAEAAAWEMIRRLRLLIQQESFSDIRSTTGIFAASRQTREPVSWSAGWTLSGTSDHAGTTDLADRRDSAVAAARLAHRFLEITKKYQPLIGGGVVLPGMNRNVIPGEARILLGVKGDIPPEDKRSLDCSLQEFLQHTLSRPVDEGGEGIDFTPVPAPTLLPLADKIRISTDTRTPDQETKELFLEAVKNQLADVAKQFDVQICLSLHQDSAPVRLDEAGVVLQMERSYGGSHNPKETEMAGDLLMGTLFQLDITRALLTEGTATVASLHKFARARLPEDLQRRTSGFVSGSFHDACNLAIAKQSIAT